MSAAIDGLQPARVWHYFAEISKIPRGSKNEKAISDYVVSVAKQFGLEVQRDKYLNVVVRKPASVGKENARMICLQGHLDMVPEKNKEKVHDFKKDPIELIREGNIIRANGTTLGADNGIAVATNLAIMEDKLLVHGPLEFLFTVDEETGLTGATNISPTMLNSKTMMNLDSEEEGSLFVGCSGGRNTVGTWKLALDNAPRGTEALKVIIKGLKGGHSGLEIEKGRGNSIKIINRVLMALEKVGARLSHIEGGNKSNAIPREAEAIIFVAKKEIENAAVIIADWHDIIKSELSSVEPDVRIVAEQVSLKRAKVLKKTLQTMIYKTISAIPHGVLKMSTDIPGLVETSTNLAIVRFGKNKIELITSQRSSVASEITESLETMNSILTLGGAKVHHTDGYPGWKPNLASPILKTVKESYRQMYGKEPEVKAIHAGLECGIIGEKYPGMDMISFGPTMEGVHSPDEKIYIDTVERFYKLTLQVLKNVN